MQEPQVGDAARESKQSGTTQTEFGRCLVDGDLDAASCARRRRRKAFGVSIGIEAVLLRLVFLSPLMTTVAQPHVSRVIYFAFATTTPRSTNPDPRPTAVDRHRWNSHHLLEYITPSAPRLPPASVREDNGESPQIGPGVLPGPFAPYTPGFVDLRPASPSPPAEATKNHAENHLLKLSEPIVQAQLISSVEPRYPVLAVQTKKEGTVILHAIISRDGRITSLEVVSGHPWFVQEALDAVRQWRYRPTMLNGEPVEVETTITVFLRLQ